MNGTKKVYSVKDNKACSFQGCYLFTTDGVAVRALTSQTMLQGNPVLKENPEDFDLYCVGSFDEETGKLEGEEPRLLIHFGEVVNDASR